MSRGEPDGTGVEVLTFGCRLNIGESEEMKAAAETAGESAVLIVNSCAVTQDAVKDVVKAIRRSKRDRPDRRIIVTGCAVEVDAERFAAMPEIDRIVPNAQKTQAGVWGSPRPGASVRRAETFGRTRAFLEVQNGCDHRCTFCIIPFGRGPSRSRTAADVVARAARFVEEGRREIVLTGVDLTSWGDDLEGAPKLGGLTRAILRSVPDLARLRLSSVDCVEVDADLHAAFAEEVRLMPHLHLSLQAGADLVLKRMKRRHTRADAIRFCREMRRARADLTFGADLIVGFPTETDAMFEETMSLVEECGATHLHVFPFSPRPGVPAARMPQTAPEIVKERAARLRALGDRLLARHLEQKIGSIAHVLVEHGARGRDEDFTRVQTPGTARRGDIVDLVVTASTGRELTGAFPTSRSRATDSSYAPARAP